MSSRTMATPDPAARVPVIVLAGRPNQGRLRGLDPAAWEALISVAGRPMISYLLKALAGSQRVDGGLVVGPPELAPLLPPGFTRVDPADSVVGHLGRAMPLLRGRRRVLLAASDVPLITSAMVDEFLDGCGDRSLDVYFPVVRRETAEARYPGARRTYVRLRDGMFTAGNLFLVNPEVLQSVDGQDGVLARLLRWRKSPWRLALALGPALLFGLLARTLSLTDVETRVARRLRLTGRAVTLADPEVGMDVDQPVDLELCREVLAHGR